MQFWQEQALKALVLLATIAALFSSVFLLFVGTLGFVGSAGLFESQMAAATLIIAISQATLCVAGCRAGLRFIDRWSAEIADQR